MEGRDDKHLKHLLDRNTCSTAPDHVRTDVRAYLATKSGNQDLLPPPITAGDPRAVSTPSTSGGTGQGHSTTPMLKRKNLFGYVDLPVTAEQATRANFKLFR